MELLQYLQLFHNIDQATFDLLSNELKPKSFFKGDYITEVGQVQKNLYFVNKGIQMSYFDSGNKVHVIAFTYPPNLCAIPESFMFQKPAPYSLKCLSDSEFNYISFSALQELFDKSQSLERLFRKMSEAILSGVITRHIELQSLTIEQRFKAFAQRSPHLFQQVPHKYIASYLGIDPTNFSKLYNSVKI